jgi:hypothetical protein
MLVLSADCIYELLVAGPLSRPVADQLALARNDYLAPPNLYIDVLELLLSNLAVGVFTVSGEVEQRMRVFDRLPLKVVSGSRLVRHYLDLYHQGLPSSDVLCICAALTRSAPLLTTRGDLAQTARELGVRVIHIS